MGNHFKDKQTQA